MTATEQLILAFFYFIPSMIAFDDKHRNRVAIFALNLLLGWTLVGWVAALVWSLVKSERPATPGRH